MISDESKEEICSEWGRGIWRWRVERGRKVWSLTFGVLCLIVVHEPPVQCPLTQRDAMAAVTTIREPTNHSLDGKQASKTNHMKQQSH